MERKRRIIKFIIFFCVVLSFAILIQVIMPVVVNKGKLSEIFLAQPAFAQQDACFPTDEAGISAYVNVGQNIDLAKAKSALRGIQAEGNNYVIGIMEIPGLPEEEFPHIYVSADGWFLAYYSKFVPASRIMHWGKYGGGNITTTTLADSLYSILSRLSLSTSTITINYYHFKYSDAVKLTLAVDRSDKYQEGDTLIYSIPSNVALLEGSWSSSGQGKGDSLTGLFGRVKIGDGSNIYFSPSQIKAGFLEGQDTTPELIHTTKLDRVGGSGWVGVAVVFIYR